MYQYLKQQSKKRLETEIVKHIIEQISLGVQYLHQREIVHRDIKLENVLIDESRYQQSGKVGDILVKLIDFGFSCQLRKEEKVKVFCGTPCYMAPEMLSKQAFRPQPVDLWAIAVLLYVLMLGRFPFRNLQDKNEPLNPQQ